MQRRMFLKLSSSGIAVAVLTPSSFFLTGCSFNVVGMLNTVLDSLSGILKVADPTASWYGTLQNAIQALKNAESGWSNGGAIAIVESALDTVSAVLAQIPVTAVYSPLIDVVVAGIEAILNYFSTQPQTQPAANRLKAAYHQNLHFNRITLRKPHFLQTEQGAYRAQFNSLAKNLGLTAATI